MVVKAGKDFGIQVMGDNLAAPDKIDAARRLEEFGRDFVIHHVGYDERRVTTDTENLSCVPSGAGSVVLSSRVTKHRLEALRHRDPGKSPRASLRLFYRA